MMKKRVLSLICAVMICFASFSVVAEDAPILTAPNPAADKITVEYNDEPIIFDVEPIIENDRTLVPFRAIFETLGCVVDYFVDDSGNQTVSALRGESSLMLNIGEPKMYFDGKEIALDVPAKIVNDRTLIPLRAVSEAFECEVLWEAETKEISIYSPVGDYQIKPARLSETVKGEDGTVLIDAVVYYPVIANDEENAFIDEINKEYEENAKNQIADMVSQKETAQMLYEQMGKEEFLPFVLSVTYEESYNVYGILSINSYTYVNTNGAHPMTALVSRSFNPGSQKELSLSDILDENALEMSLSDFVGGAFEKELEEIGITAENGGHELLYEEIGSVQYYLKKNSLVLYFNPYQIAPYAAGRPTVEIPYDSKTFLVDLNKGLLLEYTYELENDEGFEWVVVDYSKDKLSVTEEYKEYTKEERLSEIYPVGMKKITVKGINKGNAYLLLAYAEKGKEMENATIINFAEIYVEDNNLITIVTESDAASFLSE